MDNPIIVAAVITVAGVFITILVSVILNVRGSIQQRRLQHLSAVLHIDNFRFRLRHFLFGVHFLSSLERILPGGLITDDSLNRIGQKTTDTFDVFRVWVNLRERVYDLKNLRTKKGDPLEEYEQFFVNAEWTAKWRYSENLITDFKSLFMGDSPDSEKGRSNFEDFCNYARNFVAWSAIEGNFYIIFGVAPRLRRKILSLVAESLNNPSFKKWDQVEKLVTQFLQGKCW